jgi:hypothetical protein
MASENKMYVKAGCWHLNPYAVSSLVLIVSDTSVCLWLVIAEPAVGVQLSLLLVLTCSYSPPVCRSVVVRGRFFCSTSARILHIDHAGFEP